jgi:hypothetical protein
MNKKKLNLFNLFYSIGAVFILFGVICNILNYEFQKQFLIIGLSLEILIFAFSSIQYDNINRLGESDNDIIESDSSENKINIGSDTFINIQTGSENIDKIQNIPNSINTSEINNLKSIKVDINNNNNNKPSFINYVNQNENDDTIKSIKIGSQISNIDNAPIYKSSLIELENMNYITINKNIFFQPIFDQLDSTDYEQLRNLFHKIFNYTLTNKESIPFLLNFPAKIQISKLEQIKIQNTKQSLTEEEIQILFKAVSLLKEENFFNYYLIYKQDESIYIKNKSINETQIFGGEETEVLEYITQYHPLEYIISPTIDELEPFIETKNQFLLSILIDNLSLEKPLEVLCLSNIIKSQPENIKILFINKFNTISYNSINNDGYNIIKAFTIVALTISNNIFSKKFLTNRFELITTKDKIVFISDIIIYKNEFINFGLKNEYKIKLIDLFNQEQLDYITDLEILIEKLSNDLIANRSDLLDLFSIKETDSIDNLYAKLNNNLSKYKISATASQQLFNVLYKQFNIEK